MTLLILSYQVRYRFRATFASAKTTRPLSEIQEAQSQVDFQVSGLEAFVIFAIGPFMSATFYRQLTPDSAPYMSFGFHTYVTVDSEWTADAKLPRSCDKCPVRCRSQSLCCEALNVGLQARRRGGKPNRRFLSGLNSVPWVVVGATGAHCKRIQYVELPTLSTGGSNFACGLFPLIYNEAF